jgi:predicted dehydrogenase
LEQDFHMFKGGVYFEMAGHYLDLMVALLGEPTAVRPHLAAHYGDRKNVDNAVVVHEYGRCFATVDTAALHLNVDDTRRVEVYGTKGHAINMPYGEGTLELFLEESFEGYDAGSTHHELEPAADGPSMLGELAACIRGEKEPEFSFEHDLAVHRILMEGCGAPDGNALRADS